MDQQYPILEFDSSSEALINPGHMMGGVTEQPITHGVMCFFHEIVDQIGQREDASVLHTLNSEVGPNPVYQFPMNGRSIVVVQPGIGAPFSAAVLEELIALGVRKVIAVGGAGALIPDTAVGHVVVPTSAIRDEGTSYHYLPAGREVGPTATGVAAIEATLQARGVEYMTGKTWTTDAPYRETLNKIARRREEGCLTVEMEASAFFAVAQFRGIEFAQILYCGDDVSGSEWDSRHWDTHTPLREKLFWLAAEAVTRL